MGRVGEVGESYSGWKEQVTDFASLPSATGSGEVYLVLNSTGFLWNKRRGLYRDEAVGTWTRLSNTTFEVVDSDMTISDDADTTKKIDLELSGITTGNTRTLTVQDSNGTIAILEGDQTFTGCLTTTDPCVWAKNTGDGYTTISDADGLLLTSNRMDTSRKYPPGIWFGSTDVQLTTENPKKLAGFIGYCTQEYDQDTDSGMGLEFYISPDGGGTSDTPEVALSFDQNKASIMYGDFTLVRDTGVNPAIVFQVAASAGTVLERNAADSAIRVGNIDKFGDLELYAGAVRAADIRANSFYIDPDQEGIEFRIYGKGYGPVHKYNHTDHRHTLVGDVRLDSGVLTLKETTTPTAVTNYGKVYTKTDNKLYFQDGAGTEHEIAFV